LLKLRADTILANDNMQVLGGEKRRASRALVTRIATIAFSFFLYPAVLDAQIPSVSLFVGYSYARADVFTPLSRGQNILPNRTNLNGWEVSFQGRVLPFIGVVADIIVCQGPVPPTCVPPSGQMKARLGSYLFGPQFSVSIGRFAPFAHALFGASHLSDVTSVDNFSNSDTSFADALGGGIDYRLIPRVAWRLQGDALQTRFFAATQTSLRFSTGLVLRF
jgi:hypothetical protein